MKPGKMATCTFKGEAFPITKNAIDQQKITGTAATIASGQFTRLICDDTLTPSYSIFVHKALLASRSKMLKTLLKQDESVCPHIIIPDFDISVVEKLCRFLYYGYAQASKLEFKEISKLAKALGFEGPSLTISHPLDGDDDADELVKGATTSLHFSRNVKLIFRGPTSTSSLQGPPITHILTRPATEETPPQQEIVSTSSLVGQTGSDASPSVDNENETTSRKPEEKEELPTPTPKGKRKKRKAFGCTPSDDDGDSDFVPDSTKKANAPKAKKRRPSSVTSASVQSTSKPKTDKCKAPTGSRVLRGWRADLSENHVQEDQWLSQFNVCYFCSKAFNSEATLLHHLTKTNCAKHLLGHLKFDKRFCDFCGKVTDSITSWGYLKHLDLCYKKYAAKNEKRLPEANQQENESSSDSDDTIPNKNRRGSGSEEERIQPTKRRVTTIIESSGDDSNDSDEIAQKAERAEPPTTKPLSINSSAIVPIDKLRMIKEQHEGLTETRKKTNLACSSASVQPDEGSPGISPKSSGSTSITSETTSSRGSNRPNTLRIVEKVDINESESEVDDVEESMAELFSEDDFIPPKISNVFSISSNMQTQSSKHDAGSNSATPPNNSQLTKGAEQTTCHSSLGSLQTASSLSKNCSVTQPLNRNIAATKPSKDKMNAAPSTPSSVLTETPVPKNSENDIEILEIVSGAKSTARSQKQSASTAPKSTKKKYRKISLQPTWDSLLLEAVRRICSRQEQPTVGNIHRTLRALSLSENENYPIYPIFNRGEVPLTKGMEAIRRHLEKAVKQGMLMQREQNGKVIYIPDRRTTARVTSSVNGAQPKQAVGTDLHGPGSSSNSKPSEENAQLSAALSELSPLHANGQESAYAISDSDDIEVLPSETISNGKFATSSSTIVAPRTSTGNAQVRGEDTVVNTVAVVQVGAGKIYKCPNPNCGLTYEDPLKFDTHMCEDFF